MRSSLVLLMLGAGMAASGCGRGSEDPGAGGAVQPRALLLTSPPHAFPSVGFTEIVTFARGQFDSPILTYLTGDDDVTATLPNTAGILWLGVEMKLNVEYLMIGSIDGTGVFTLSRMHDATSDGLPDLSTRTVLFTTSPTPAYFTQITAESGGRVFALDARVQDIRTILVDQDGWPTQLLATPFAPSSTYPQLETVGHIQHLADEAQVGVLALVGMGPPPGMRGSFPYTTYRDTNSDNVCDQVTAVNPDEQAPLVRGLPFVGQSSMELKPGAGTLPRTAQIWRLDATGQDVAQLASASLTSADTWTSVALSQSLATGWTIAVRFAGAPATQTVHPVVSAWPQVLSITPDLIPQNTATAVTISGLNFASNMTMKLSTMRDVEHAVNFTYVSPTQVTATIPALSDWGEVFVWAVVPAQPSEDGIMLAGICMLECPGTQGGG